MPGYEPFLLCDFHVHTQWSDGRLTLRQVIDLYGKTRRFDVIAITDHILMRRDVLARAGRLVSLGRREFSVTEDRFAVNSTFRILPAHNVGRDLAARPAMQGSHDFDLLVANTVSAQVSRRFHCHKA